MTDTTDNLVERSEKAGFENINVQADFMSKYLIARKPAFINSTLKLPYS